MIVLDTSVVSYIFNRDSRASYYLGRISGDTSAISFQTIEEMWFGAFKGNWGERRRNQLSLHLQQYEIIWPSPELVETCAHLRMDREKAGRRLEVADAWIAATALMLQCPLASHDRDFSDIPGLQFIRNPVR